MHTEYKLKLRGNYMSNTKLAALLLYIMLIIEGLRTQLDKYLGTYQIAPNKYSYSGIIPSIIKKC